MSCSFSKDFIGIYNIVFMMLSNLVITSQSLVLIIDELNQEKVSRKVQIQLLQEQGQDNLTTKILPLSTDLKDDATLSTFVDECAQGGPTTTKWNVILPPLSDLLCYQRPSQLFQFIHKLRRCERVQRVFLWLSAGLIMHPRLEYLIAAFEYMADLILRFESASELSITTRKSGGSVTNKSFTYRKTPQGQYHIEPLKSDKKSTEMNTTSNTNPIESTFKIELDEMELQARNAMKMPYEKAAEPKESAIIYTPDAADDYDEEDDLDDDLCI